MKKLDSPLKNFLYFGYRMTAPIFDPIKAVKGIISYPGYVRDLIKFYNKKGFRRFNPIDLYPILDEKTAFTSFDFHYFFQQLWVFENVYKQKPEKHVDVGSTYQMSGYLSVVVPTEFVDIRPIDTEKDNLTIIKGSALKLPYETGSLQSVSCLHVLEHIGLGRYDSDIYVDGFERALRELLRVLKPGGILYLSTPIGRERVCFNAHRISDPRKVIQLAETAQLASFDIVNDAGKYIKNYDQNDCEKFNYALGMFKFIKQ